MCATNPKKVKFLNNIKIGDVYKAKVEELIESGEAIVNFDGNLIRVKNECNLKVNDVVILKVKSLFPNLKFEVISKVIK